MKKLITFVLLVIFCCGITDAQNGKIPTLKEQMQLIHEHFGVNFIYDSSIELDKEAPRKIDPRRQNLEECLAGLFTGTDLEWEVMKKYVVLTHKDKKRKPRDYTIFIEEQHDTLNESVITALAARDLNTTQTGFEKIDGKTFNQGFAILSSPDVIKTLQQLPGVATGTELLSGMYVRGGDGADNLYLLDGVPLYQVSHLAGLFSSFNTDLVESVDFYKSGFPARYGGRLSSVVDVKTREGDFNDYHGLFSIGLIDGRMQFEGPIVKGKTAFNIGLRRSWLDVITEPVGLIISQMQDTDFRIKYAFWDLNGNITHKFSEDNKLSLNLYGGRDALKYVQGNKDKEFVNNHYLIYHDKSFYGLEWGNFVTSLDWDWKFTDNHELAAKIYFSRYSSKFGTTEENIRLRDGVLEQYSSLYESYNHSRTSDIGFKADFSFRAGDRNHIRYGTSLQQHFYTPEYIGEKTETHDGKEILEQKYTEDENKRSFESAAYIENEIIISEWFTANLGLRYSTALSEGKYHHSLQPRAALRFSLGDYTSVKMSYSEMTQYNHQISSNYLQLPTSFWMPSTEKIGPSKSRQASAGIYINLPYNIKLNTEGYFKTMDNLLEFSGRWGIYPPITHWEEALTTGKGRSWGLESELSWADEITSVTLYYTLSWSQRYFDEFFPEWYRDRNDNRHKLTLTATRKFGKRFEIYTSWNWHSGGWITSESHAIQTGKVEKSWPESFYNAPNNIKTPDYHRLDIGFNFRKTTKRGNESIWNLSLYNAYCNMNPTFNYIDTSYEFTKENLTGLKFTGEVFGIIPIIPSFSYTLKF